MRKSLVAERALGNDAFEFDALHCLAEAHIFRGAGDAALEAQERMRVTAFAGYATERIARERLDAILRTELDAGRLRALRLEGARATDDASLASLPIELRLASQQRLA